MKKVFCGLVLMFVFSDCLFAQESTSENEAGLYTKAGAVYSHQFKLNNTLNALGCKKIPNVFAFGVVGIYYDIKKIALTMDVGTEGLYNKKTQLLNFLANVSVGYKLALPKKQSLIFAGNIGYDMYNVTTYIEKGNLDFQNAILNNSTAFSLGLIQFMVGPKITWRNEICYIGIGYDFGVIPTRWKSDNINILNSPKERIDRVHLSFAVNIARY